MSSRNASARASAALQPPAQQSAPAQGEADGGTAAPAPHRKPLPLTASRDALLVNGSDREFRELVHNMLAFASAIQEVRNRLGQLIGLSGTQYTILTSIARLSAQTPELGVNQLAEHLHLSGAFVTIEVNKLVAAGLVTKRTNAEDRRRVVLAVTAEAQRRLEEMTRVQCPANDALFETLDGADFRALHAIMSKLANTGDRTLRLIDYMAPGGTLEEAVPPPRAGR